MSDVRILLRSYIKETCLGKMLRRIRNNRRLGNRSEAEKFLERYMTASLGERERKEILEDMIRMSKQYRYGYDEYFLYNFQQKTESERLKFVADLDRVDIVESLNKAKNQPLFDDKALTYSKYKKYYHRELCSIGGGVVDYDKLEKFLLKHRSIIIKPADSSCGNGIQIIKMNESDSMKSVLVPILSSNKRGLIAEEIINQQEQMARLHPQSVNTLRITTLRMNNEIKILHPFLKIGRGESVVDNGGKGGILCIINPHNGIVTHTSDEMGMTYEQHPDTGAQIVGFQIPKWEEALALVKELATITPSNRYTGWDIALSEQGWVLVEANARGQFVGWQITTQIGFKDEICDLLLQISRKKYRKMVCRLKGERYA